MPRRKHYWPCSHHFNYDIEVQKLRRDYGDWMGFVWMQMLSIADENDGVVMGTPEQIGVSLAHISLSMKLSWAARRIVMAVSWMVDRGWIEVQSDRVLVLKYAKYHDTREKNSGPPILTNPNQTNQTNIREEQKLLPAPPNGGAGSPLLPGLPPATGKKKKKVEPPDTDFTEAFQAWPNHDDEYGARVHWRKAHITPEILALVKSETGWWTEEVDSGRKDKQYVPMFKNWLRDKRWNDHHVVDNGPPEIEREENGFVWLKNSPNVRRTRASYDRDFGGKEQGQQKH